MVELHRTQYSHSSVEWLSHVWLFATPWTAACQASLSNSQSLLKLMPIKSVMPSNHLNLLFLPSIYPSIRIFSNESVLCIRWPKYWSFNFSISLSNEYSELISFRIDWFHLLAIQGTQKSSPTRQFKSINSSALNIHIQTQMSTSKIGNIWKISVDFINVNFFVVVLYCNLQNVSLRETGWKGCRICLYYFLQITVSL